MFDKNLPIPIYVQLKNYIKENIDNKTYAPGQMLPSEREFTEKFSVSRMTVRQAISDLVNEGLLYREQGKGTFIARNIIEKQAELLSFSQDMANRGFTPGSRLIEFSESIPNEFVREKLQLGPDERIYNIKRLRLADNMPMAIENCHLPAKLYPNLFKYNFERCSLYEIMKDDYGIKYSHAQQVIEVKKLKKNDALLLLEKENGYCLMASRTLFSDDNVIIEYTETGYHPDRYKYTMILT
jgi:GntR family transcriptional regulator